MKENLSRMLRSGLALLMALCLVAGFIPTAAFAAEVSDVNDDGVINYVSFGASNANGYGLSGYMPAGVTAENKDTANVYGYQRMPAESYPYLIAAALNEAAGGEVSTAPYDGKTANDPFEKVDVDQLAMSSMRMEELRFLLDETYAGDSYTDWRFYDVNGDGNSQNWFGMAENNLDTLRDVYKNAVAEADVITLDMGINNFGVYISHQVGNKYGETLEDIDPALAAKYAEAKAYVKGLAAQSMGEAAAMLDEMDGMIDALAYALVGFCVSFDVVMEEIRELNPDAIVVVVSIQNLLTDLYIEIEGFDQALPLGDLFGAVINAANLYTAARSPYADEYLYADVRKDGRVEFFVDALLAYNGDPATLTQNMIDCFNVYDDDLHAKKNVMDMVEAFLAGQIEDGLGAYIPMVAAIYGTGEPNALLAAYLADGANDFATAKSVVAYVGTPEAAACLAQMEVVYDAYVEAKAFYTPLALNVGYDVLTEIFKAAVEDHTINFSALSSDIKGDVEDGLLAEIANAVISSVEKLAVDPTYNFDINEAYPDGFFETIAATAGLDAKLVKSIACMGVRTGIGNSFYGHPTPYGHTQIADTILAALDLDVTGEDVVVGEVKILLDELYALVETYGPEAAAQVWEQWVEYGYVDAVETSISELKAMLTARYTYYTETALPAIETSIAQLAAQQDALGAELAALKAELEAKKAELEAAINGIEIGAITVPEVNIDVELGNNEQTQIPENNCTVNGESVEAELEAAIKDLEHAIATIEALIADIEADIADMIALAEQIAAAVAELEKTMAEVEAAVADLETAIETIIAIITDTDAIVAQQVSAFEAARDTAAAAVNVLSLTIGTAESMMADVDAMIEKICADADALYEKFVTDLPACIEQIPEEAIMLVGGSAMLLEKAYELNKAEIDAALEAELAKLAAEYEANKQAALAELAALAAEYNISEEAILAELAKLELEYANAEAALKAELAAIEAQIAEEVAAKYAVVEAEINAQIEAAKAEAAVKLAALNEELKAYEEALIAAATEEAKAAIQPQIDRVLADIATVEADLACAIAHLENAAEIAYEQIVAEITEAYEEAVAAVEQKIAELEAAYNAAVAAVEQKIAELKAAYDAAVAAVEQKIAELEAAYNAAVAAAKAAAEQAIAELKAAVDAKLEELNNALEAVKDALTAQVEGVLDAIHNELAGMQAALEEILQGNLAAVEALKDALVEMGAEAIVEAAEALIEAVMAMIEEATTADLVIDNEFKYVAIGDGSAAAESYVEKLAAALSAEAVANGVDEIEFVNNAYVGNTVTAERENLSDVTDADLITIGFSNVEFLNAALNNAMNGVELDWAAIVGEENVHYVEELLAEVAAEIAASGVTGEYAAMANAVIESYAYSMIQYAVELPQLINEINAINPEALIIIVGMYNPLADAVIALDENTSIDLGEYIDYLVAGVAVHGIAYSIISGNSIYVDAPAVQTVNTDAELSALDLMRMIMNGFADLYPSAVGDDYIAAEICDALNITYVKDILLGDVNLDGIVDQSDVALLFAYVLDTESLIAQQLLNADVNFDGEVDQSDLTKLFSFVLGEIESL